MSTDKQSSGSPADQIARCRPVAKSRGHQVAHSSVFADRSIAGTLRDNSLGLLSVCGRVEPGLRRAFARAFFWACIGALLLPAATGCSDVERTRVRAWAGSVKAQSKLGRMYRHGEGVPKDAAQAVTWLGKAAAQGSASAQFHLGGMTYRGEGVQKDVAEAMAWFRKAADQGYAKAQLILGAAYSLGEGVPKDDTVALAWYLKAAEQELGTAELKVAEAYAKGLGTPDDDTEAIKWYRRAAERGEAKAQSELGARYAQGRGVVADGSEAVNWYVKAAESGDDESLYALAVIYLDGKLVAQDLGEANKWWILSSASKFPPDEMEKRRSEICKGTREIAASVEMEDLESEACVKHDTAVYQFLSMPQSQIVASVREARLWWDRNRLGRKQQEALADSPNPARTSEGSMKLDSDEQPGAR